MLANDQTKSEWGLSPASYELVQDLAFDELGCPTVQLAVHHATNDRVAIKRIPCEMLNHNRYADCLLRHVALSRTLHHPNLAPVHVAFITEASGTPARMCTHENPPLHTVGEAECWVVQMLFDRGTLSDLIKTTFSTGFDEAQTAYILREVLRGVEALHVQGIVHRGITPRGIFVHSDGRICLSRLHASVELDPSAMLHDLHEDARLIPWAAPEMLRQDLTGYNSKIDVYSIGILALQLVTGRHPFANQTNTLMMLNKLQESPPTLASVCPDHARRFSNHFATFIDACLQDIPEYRPTVTRLLAHSFFKQVRRVPSLVADASLQSTSPDLPLRWIARRRSSVHLLSTPGALIKRIDVTYHAFPSLLSASGLAAARKGRLVQLDLGCDDEEADGSPDGLGRVPGQDSPVSVGSGHAVGREWSTVAADPSHNGSAHSSSDFMPREAVNRRSQPPSPVVGTLSPRSSPAHFRRSAGSGSGSVSETPALYHVASRGSSSLRFHGRHRRGHSMDNGRLGGHLTASFDASVSSGGEGGEGYMSGAEGGTASFRRRLRRRSRAVSMGSEENLPAHAGVLAELGRLWRSVDYDNSHKPAVVARDGDSLSALSSTPSDAQIAMLSTTPRSHTSDHTLAPSSVRSGGGFAFFRSISGQAAPHSPTRGFHSPKASGSSFVSMFNGTTEPAGLVAMPDSPVAVHLQPPSRKNSRPDVHATESDNLNNVDDGHDSPVLLGAALRASCRSCGAAGEPPVHRANCGGGTVPASSGPVPEAVGDADSDGSCVIHDAADVSHSDDSNQRAGTAAARRARFSRELKTCVSSFDAASDCADGVEVAAGADTNIGGDQVAVL